MSLIAHCHDCQKRFRVPHAERTWNCKECGGELVLQDDEQPQLGSETPNLCPKCESELEPDAAFCEACGHALTGSREQAERAEAKVAGAEMRKAMKQIRTLKSFLWISLIFGLFQLGIITLIAFSGGAETALLVVALGLVSAFCGLSLLGIYQVERRPFPIVLSLALLRTLYSALELLGGDISTIGLLFTVWMWYLLVPAARLGRLAREHPELYLSKHMRGELERSAEGMSAEDSIGRRVRSKERARGYGEGLRMMAIGALVLAVTVGALWALATSSGPTDSRETLEAFQQAWNLEDPATIGGFARPERVETWTSNVKKLQRRYDWGEDLPPLDGYTITSQGETHVNVDYHCEELDLGAKFKWDDGRWALTGLDLRAVKDWRP